MKEVSRTPAVLLRSRHARGRAEHDGFTFDCVKYKKEGGSRTKMPPFFFIFIDLTALTFEMQLLGGAREGRRRAALSATLNGNFPCGFHDLDAAVLSARHRLSTHATSTRNSALRHSLQRRRNSQTKAGRRSRGMGGRLPTLKLSPSQTNKSPFKEESTSK